MATSFNVNKADLEFILKQIQLAETTSVAYTAIPKTILQAIMDTYGVTQADATLLPYGLRTVDGSDNNLLPGGSQLGAADTLFPRLTDPNFLNDQDGDTMVLGPFPAPTITNTDYGLQQSVADADPRIISNLIVDMTAANPAAVEAALRYAGLEGDVSALRDAIVDAYKNIAATATAAHQAELAETAALAVKNQEILEQAAADAANSAAQATLTAYNNALAANADSEATQAKNAVQTVVTTFGPVNSVVNSADITAIDAAVLEATQARDAAQSATEALLVDLTPDHPDVLAAQALQANAQTLLQSLINLQASLDSTTPNLDTTEFDAAATASADAGNLASLADTATAQLTISQGNAQTTANATAAALLAANNTVTVATTAYNTAVVASDTADQNLADAQADLVAAQAIQATAAAARDAAFTIHQPFAQTITAYFNALAQNVEQGFSLGLLAAVDEFLTVLGGEGEPVDQADLDAIASAITAANLLIISANNAVVALQSGPLVLVGDLAAAQTDAATAVTLRDRLVALETQLQDGLIDLTDAEEATALGADTLSAAGIAITTADTLTVSHGNAITAGQPTAVALAAAQTELDNAIAAVELLEEAILGPLDELTGARLGGGLADIAADAQVAEAAALATLTSATTAQAAALAADNSAQAVLTAYNSALDQDVEVKAHATVNELTGVGQLIALLGPIGSIIEAADLAAADEAIAAANLAAAAATSAANTLLAALDTAHADVVTAQAVADAAVSVASQLIALRSALGAASPLLDQSEYDAAQAALALATANELQANNLDAQLNLSQDLADSAATAAFNALQLANQELADATTAHADAVATSNAADAARDAAPGIFQNLVDSNGIEVEHLGSLVIPNLSPDIGLSPGFNSWMTFFGQFFDHGLDLVTKGNNGTVYIPLQADDPLIAGADGIFGTEDDLPAHLRFMALTRATVTLDANGVPQHENTTTPFIDQNQTYTSHPSHQVFLREYVRVGDQTLATGRLIDGTTASGSLDGAIGNWAEVKAQSITMLGLKLDDFDVHNVPLLVTDQYGKFVPGANGYAQVVVQVQIINDATGNVVGTQGNPFVLSGIAGGLDLANLSVPSGLPALPSGQSYKTVTVGTNHAFLNDIAHHAAPTLIDADHDPATAKTKQVADADSDANHNGVYDEGDTLTDVNGDGVISTADFFADDKNDSTYDDEMLASHYITGDGRGNENIALTAVHSVFHSEHNRIVEANKATILNSGDLAFINEWLRTDIASLTDISTQAQKDVLIANDAAWDGERLFQAARFSTEMQYQHLVFEEFARRIQPMVDPFVFNPSPNIDPSIVAEFAHTVYRFGHSMLTGTVDRLENDLSTVNGEADQQTLIAAFLNPQMYVSSGADQTEALANIVRGTARDLGNEIDEFIVQDVRSNLLGLPLDLGALNIARGRDTGIPSLNETRAQLQEAGAIDLVPYTGWNDFAQNIKNPLSVVNFIAAYGTHASLTQAGLTAEQMRDAAMLLVFGDGDNSDGVTIRGVTYSNQDRVDFLNGVGAYAADNGGMDLVDLWIGGLAERKNEFGGMLGQTFNYVFEYQMEQLQFGDRFYYLSRTQGTNLLNQLEPNTFADLVMRNSALGDDYATHVSGQLFLTPDFILELDRGIAQEDYNGGLVGDDPTGTVGLFPKVTRDYAGASQIVVNGVTHDVGGYIKFLGGEHLVVGGTEGNDEIRTDLGIDTIWGDGGDDYINAGQESDDVFGGEGDDVIDDPFGDDVLRGNQGNDVIRSARGFDLIFGGEGMDYLQLGQDASEVFGGTGDDFILGGVGNDFLLGNEGNDWVEGAGGFDTLAGENSELFFNSPIIGHDVLLGQGDESDYDAESGDDIMVSAGGTVQRMEGMFGFDWGIAKNDLSAINFDLAIPIFTTDPADILRDRFDQVEALSGWKFDDQLTGDSVGHVDGSNALPSATPTPLAINNQLDAEGIARIIGLDDLLNGALQTFDLGSTFRDGNILLGGDGNDILMGRGGFDILDGDAWLNVRIKINVNGTIYSAESLNTDTSVAGPFAGKVYNTDANGNPIFSSPAFGGQSLQSLLLDRTIKPGQMSIVREILYDTTPGDNDTARFQGTLAEYDIEGRGIVVDGVVQRAFDLNGDGFISVRDQDTGVGGGGGLTRGTLRVDDTDLLKNIEILSFSDQSIAIAGTNQAATGTVTINDPTPFGGVVTPFIGQVLTASLTAFTDADGVPLTNGLPTGLSFEWQTSADDNQAWKTVAQGNTYTVALDPELGTAIVIRAVAVFKDATGLTERIYSDPTASPQPPFAIDENSATGTIVGLIPPADPRDNTLVNVINPVNDAGGRFTVVQNGTDAAGNPQFQLVVANGGSTSLDYEAVQTPVDNQYQVIVDTFDTTGALVLQREFTIMLRDVVNEGVPTNITWTGTTPPGNALPAVNTVIANLSTVDPDVGATHTYQLLAGSSPGFTLSAAGVVRAINTLAPNSTYTLNVRSTDNSGLTFDETFTVRTLANNVANVFIGTAGDDVAYGLTGADNLSGGSGDDNLFGQNGNDALIGDAGNDLLVGGAGADILSGGSGNDTIRYTVGDGADTVDGGADIDTLNILDGTGNNTLDVLYDGSVITSVEGGTISNIELVNADMGGAADTLSYAGSVAGVTVDLANGVSSGTASGFNQLMNVLHLTGTDQADILSGNNGNNILTGGGGADVLNGEGGSDTVNGGAGADIINYVIGDGADTVNGGGGTDTLNITDGTGNNTLDVLYDGSVITSVEGGTISNIELVNADMGGAADTLSYAGSIAGVTVDLADGVASGTASGFNQLISVLHVTGTDQADTLSGNSGANILIGGGGDDQLNGEAGDDIFNYVIGLGADTVDGGGGTDTLNITDGTGNNTVDVLYDGSVITSVENGTISNIELVNADMGGAADTLSYAGSIAGVTVDLADGVASGTASGFNQLISVLHVTGTDQADTLSGNSGNNILTGGAGADQLNGEAGNDTLDGGAGADILIGGAGADQLNGEAGNDTLDGGAGADVLIGGAGADQLNGEAGNDTLDGGAGADVLIGGAGADTINTGATDDDLADLIQFSATGDFSDTINNFDATGTVAQVDQVQFGGALNTLFDDVTANDIIQFSSGNGVNGGNTAVNLNTTVEALFLSGLNGEGVTNANLTAAGAVATEFNAEFALTAANGESTLLVINDTDGNSAAVWQWTQAGGGEITAAELTLVGVINANATVAVDNFGFVA